MCDTTSAEAFQRPTRTVQTAAPHRFGRARWEILGAPQEMQPEPRGLARRRAPLQCALGLVPCSLASVLGLRFLPPGSPLAAKRAPQRTPAARQIPSPAASCHPTGAAVQGTSDTLCPVMEEIHPCILPMGETLRRPTSEPNAMKAGPLPASSRPDREWLPRCRTPPGCTYGRCPNQHPSRPSGWGQLGPAGHSTAALPR